MFNAFEFNNARKGGFLTLTRKQQGYIGVLWLIAIAVSFM